MEESLLRYSCQLMLPGFGEAMQQKLKDAKVLVVGAGGLGCPALQYLVSSGIGTVGIADGDIVSIGNLHRQILYDNNDIGSKKVAVAAHKLRQQNPLVDIVPYTTRVDSGNVMELVKQYDLVVDCSDNFDTRYLLNDTCVLAGKPLVYGAIYQYEGQLAVWNLENADGTRSPNYRDLYPEVDAAQIPDCATGGVIPTLAGMIGCMQANEVIKYFTGIGEALAGKLLVLDAKTLQSRIVNIGTVTQTVITCLKESVDIPVISVKDLKAAVDKGLYEIVDVRTLEEREVYNIGGKHIPLGELENKFSLENSIRQVVFYCASGKRSADAVKRLLNKYPNGKFYSLDGGLKAWKEHDSLL